MWRAREMACAPPMITFYYLRDFLMSPPPVVQHGGVETGPSTWSRPSLCCVERGGGGEKKKVAMLARGVSPSTQFAST